MAFNIQTPSKGLMADLVNKQTQPFKMPDLSQKLRDIRAQREQTEVRKLQMEKIRADLEASKDELVREQEIRKIMGDMAGGMDTVTTMQQLMQADPANFKTYLSVIEDYKSKPEKDRAAMNERILKGVEALNKVKDPDMLGKMAEAMSSTYEPGSPMHEMLTRIAASPQKFFPEDKEPAASKDNALITLVNEDGNKVTLYRSDRDKVNDFLSKGYTEGGDKSDIRATLYDKTPVGNITDEDDNTVGMGRFNREIDEYEVKDENGWRSLKSGEKIVTAGSVSGKKMTDEQMKNHAQGLVETETALQQLKRYFASVEGARQGWKLVADQVIGTVSTFFDGDIPTNEALQALKGGKQLQALIGRFRTEVVGGGVMTEFDALRVIAALGGDATSTRSRQVVGELLREIAEDKIRMYNDVDLPTYMRQRDFGRGYYPEKKPLNVNDFFGEQETKGSSKTSGEKTEYSFTTPDGKTRYFKSQEHLDNFQKLLDAKLKAAQ